MIPDMFNAGMYSMQDKHTFWRYSFSSFFAHAITRSVLAPVERLKIIMQTQQIMKVLPSEKYTTYCSAFKRIRKEQGLLSFWRGNTANIQRVIPTNWAKFATFIHAKEVFFPNGEARYKGADLLMRHFACGMCSVFMVQFLAYPFDIVRTRQICDQSKKNETRIYNGTWNTMKKLARTERYASLYKGFWINYACGAPYLALAYTIYEHIRAQYHPSAKDPKPLPDFFLFKLMGAGGLAAAAASLVMYPLDTIKRRMMVNGGAGFEKQYRGFFDCMYTVMKQEGVKGFYSGMLANMVKIVPALGLQFSINDTTRMLIFE